jgi:hypothetical protein
MHTGGGLLGDALDVLGDGGPALGILRQRAGQQLEDDRELLVVGRGRVRHGAGRLELDALVDEQRGVATVVEDHVRPVLEARQGLLGAPPVLLEGLALPGVHRDAPGVLGRAVGADRDGGGGVILGGEDVAGDPADLGAERDERLDEHSRLDRHVQRAHDLRALQRLGVGELGAGGHEAGHLMLGEDDLLAAVVGQADVRDLEVGLGLGRAHAVSLSEGGQATPRSRSCRSCSKRSQSPGSTSTGRSGVETSQASTAPASSGSLDSRRAKATSESATS